MKKAMLFVLLIAVAFGLAFIGGFGAEKVRAELLPVKAYQVWVHSEDKFQNESGDFYFARRSDGVSVRTSSTGVTALNLSPRGITMLFSKGNSNVMTRGDGKPAIAKDFKEDCSDSVSTIPGEAKNILGFDTLHEASTSQRSDIEEHINNWVAPALNCFPLEEVTTFYRDGKVFDMETKTATKVALGEPPEDVFKIPGR